MSTGVRLVAAFSTSLFISSFLITFFAMSIYGAGVTTMELPNGLSSFNAPSSYSNVQDFTNENNYNVSLFTIIGSWKYNSGIGLINDASYLLGELYISNVKLNSIGNVKNTYYINNSALNDYSIVLRKSDNMRESNNELYINEKGFYIPDSSTFISIPVWLAYKDFISYPNANKIKDVIITTDFNNNDNTVSFSFNGETFSMSKLNTVSVITGNDDNIYAGIKYAHPSFTLQKFSTGYIGSNNYNTPANENTLSQIVSFVSAMLDLLSFGYPDAVIPITLQILLIRTQEFLILIGLVAIVRGI